MASPNPVLLAEDTASAATSSIAAPEGADTNTQIAGAANVASAGKMSSLRSLGDLKKKAPEVYNAMMQSLAWGICGEMQKHQKRLKELIREGQKNNH